MNPAEDALLHISHQQREGSRRIAERMERIDLLALYETIGMAATTINVAADSIYAAHLMGQKPWLPMTDAKAAAERVLRALKEYEDQIETMEGVS